MIITDKTIHRYKAEYKGVGLSIEVVPFDSPDYLISVEASNGEEWLHSVPERKGHTIIDKLETDPQKIIPYLRKWGNYKIKSV